MSEIAKLGQPYQAKVETSSNLTGKAANFSAYYIKPDKSKVEVVGSFTEDDFTPGMYYAPAIDFTVQGNHTLVVYNDTDGMDHTPTTVTVNGTDVNDIKSEIDSLRTVMDTVAVDVDGLDGQNLEDIKVTLESIKKLSLDTADVRIAMDGDESSVLVEGATITGDTSGATANITKSELIDGTTVITVHGVVGVFEAGETVSDGTTSTTATIATVEINTVNSIVEFVTAINTAVADGNSTLSALSGYTDDIENMQLGTEFLADGVTANPLFGADNATLKTLIEGNLVTLQGNLSTAQSALEAKVTEAKDAVLAKVAEAKTVIDNSDAKINDASYGLEAIKAYLETVTTDIGTAKTSILDVLNDSAKGLVGIYDTMVTRFNTVDSKLDSIEGKIDSIGGAQGFRVI